MTISPLHTPQTGMVFVFNLIVGTGALTLPSVFSRAGWLLGSVIVLLLAFLSYVTLTFVIEASSCANALAHHRRLKQSSAVASAEEDDEEMTEDETVLRGNSDVHYAPVPSQDTTIGDQPQSNDEERTPLFLIERQKVSGHFSLDDKFELGDMAALFFRPWGRLLFYLCMSVYLYGDLAIYNAAVSKSITDVVCGRNASGNLTGSSEDDDIVIENDDDYCWEGGLHRHSFYRLSMVAFVCLLGPFVFFNLTKTKSLQLLTAVFRWLAFFIMIVLACLRFVNGTADGQPPVADWIQVPNLFGACIYSFMCHHSIPSLVAPIRQKDRIKGALGIDYLGVSCFYLLLAMTGSFAFRHLQDLYTLNFVPDDGGVFLKLVEYFLALFPVFTLGASYPIIGITLRNNLKILLEDVLVPNSPGVSKFIFPLLTVVPPLLVTLNTENIKALVRFTGSYAGAGIQYLIPVALIYLGRKKTQAVLGNHIPNRFQSPFKHGAWLLVVVGWTVLCISLVTMTFIRS